jgi:hypothetical protein
MLMQKKAIRVRVRRRKWRTRVNRHLLMQTNKGEDWIVWWRQRLGGSQKEDSSMSVLILKVNQLQMAVNLTKARWSRRKWTTKMQMRRDAKVRERVSAGMLTS